MKTLKFGKKESEFLSLYKIDNVQNQNIKNIIFSPGEKIVRQQNPIISCYIILSGRAKVYTSSEDGKNLIIGYYEKGEILGEVELVTGQKNSTTTVCAITDLNCIEIDYDFLKNELKKNIEFSNIVSVKLAEKLIKSTTSLTNASLYSYSQRLSDYILKNSYRGYFSSNLTEAALSIGISYRHLLRLLNSFLRIGALEKDKHLYRIKDEKKIEYLKENKVKL